jgi:hypothetical protein
VFSGRGRFFWACKTSINLILEKLILAKTEEQRVEERGTSIWRDFHSVSYKIMQALKPSTRWEAWRGSPKLVRVPGKIINVVTDDLQWILEMTVRMTL